MTPATEVTPKSGSKLLFVVNDTRFFLSHRLPIAQAAARHGYTVHVATGDIKTEERRILDREGFDYHALPLSRRGMNPLKELATVWALYRLFRQLRPQIVHLVTMKPVLYGGVTARLARVPAVVQALSGLGYLFLGHHSARRQALRLALRPAYQRALGHPRARVIFQNPDDQALFVDRGLVRQDKARMIKGSGVDPDTFSPVQPSPELPEQPIVMLAARMLWDKGVGEFVDAAKLLKQKGVHARFVLAGGSDPGNPSAVSEDTLRQWHNEGTVEWWGHQTNMHKALSQAHIMCLPSYREGLPKVLIEAAACALPLVSTDVPGCREITRGGVNGRLVPPRDASALAVVLEELIDQPELCRRFGEAGRELVLREFTIDHVVRQTLAVYDEFTAPGDTHQAQMN